MPITFEEITGDIVPDRRPEEPGQERSDTEDGGQAFAERVRAALIREKRRLERLSDR